MNKLILGDNLQVMQSLESESIDLIITDPPFFSQRDYGEFDDRWKDLSHYLDFMKDRLVECHRLLKDTGTLYLHCDTSASHYLKVELDTIFGYSNFRNEIIWKYNKWSGAANKFQRSHDIIFYYRKTDKVRFNPVYEEEMTKSMIEKRKRGYVFNERDKNGNRMLTIYDPNTQGSQKHLNSGEFSEEQIKYLPDAKVNNNKKMTDVWTDIPSLGVANQSKERTGYPTQKPIKLYQRIIKASSNEGNTVLDPSCGAGTTADAAQSLNRKWICIDQNENAIKVAEKRLKDNYGLILQYEVVNHERKTKGND